MNVNRGEEEQRIHLHRIWRFNRLYKWNGTWVSQHRQTKNKRQKTRRKCWKRPLFKFQVNASVRKCVGARGTRTICRWSVQNRIATVSQLLSVVTDSVPIMENRHERNGGKKDDTRTFRIIPSDTQYAQRKLIEFPAKKYRCSSLCQKRWKAFLYTFIQMFIIYSMALSATFYTQFNAYVKCIYIEWIEAYVECSNAITQ